MGIFNSNFTTNYLKLYFLESPTLTFTFELEEYLNEVTHFKVIDSALDIQVHGLKFDFKHLFSNKRLNKEFNSEFSAKGMQAFVLFKHVGAIFGPYFHSVFINFLVKVPVGELFDGL